MIFLTLLLAAIVALAVLFKRYTSARYKTAPLKIKSKAMEKIASAKTSELTMDSALKKCPLFSFYPGESAESMLGWNKILYKHGDAVGVHGMVMRGEVEVFHGDHLVCVKEKGALLSGAMELLGLARPGVRRARGEVEILPIDISPVKSKMQYVLFSMFRKSCVELVCKYFELETRLVEKETIKIRSEGSHSEVFGGFLNEKLQLALSQEGRDVLGASIEMRTDEEDLKKEGEAMDSVLYVAEGCVLVAFEENVFEFEAGSVFGYFSLFFDAYSSARIHARPGSRVLACRSSALLRLGLDVCSFDYSMVEGIDMLCAVDMSAEWMRLSPGDMLAQKGDGAKEIFYISAGNVKTASGEFSSGMVLGGRECIVGDVWEETAVAIKITDAVRIPSLLLDYAFENERPFFKKYTRRLFARGRKENGKIVSIVPTGKFRDAVSFSRRLKAAIGPSSLLLSRRDVVDVLAKKAFDATEELRFMDYLTKMSRRYEIVLICVENGYSRLLKHLLSFSDTLLVVGTSFLDLPEYNTYCGIELAKVYEERRASKSAVKKVRGFEGVATNKRGEPVHYDRLHHVLSPSKTIMFCSKDFQRLGRSLLGRRVGLVLSGGGARGLAHIGVIQALEEEGIPIDCIGGTSMGAFIGALYAKECNNYYVFKQAKRFATKMSNLWLLLLDLTYPICSMFSGYTFNNSLHSVFKDELIQDLWLEYFCITTNLAAYEEEVHRSGVLWRYVRASMGLCGYLPPICENGKLLVDGGYLNNVPADVMMDMQVERIVTVDVGTILENDYFDYGDALSGFTVLFNKFFGNKRFLTMEDIQYRLAYIPTERKMKELSENEKIIMLKPDLGKHRTMDFKKFDEIVACGYQSAKKAIAEWKQDSRFEKFFSGLARRAPKRRYSV